jgi:hypothetical protein
MQDEGVFEERAEVSNPVQKQSRREFAEFELAASLPKILLIYGTSRLPAGAMEVDLNTSTIDLDSHRWAMEKMWFFTPNRINGVLHYQGPAQLFFLGYKCSNCNRVFLVPDIKWSNELSDAMRHACHV